ncbi:lysozyme [Caulobacter sp. NIBR1757]|uniref:lysozyme n=1 Tax=Caulobacter sp. NIBR1757 TaxID=3016000 RepID=UPI0022EFF2DB|nr:lysozyme [Caulobacter sp. NIBR1757]
MKPRHQVSKAAVELIKTFEGYRSKAAQLPDGRWTIGFGHTLTAREGAQVSEQDAEALLLYDLIAIAHAVNEQTFTPLTQNQFDALCCFAFNVGIDNFKRSSVLRRVNEGSLLQAACAMEMWRKADFEGERIVVDALVRRRSAEKTLFLTPANGWVPAPSPIVRPKVDYDAVNFVPRQTPTALKTDLTADKAVAERDEPLPSPHAPPESTPPQPVQVVTASMTAAAAVTSRLAQLVPEPVVVPPPVPAAAPVVSAPVADESLSAPVVEAPPLEVVASQTADESLAWSPTSTEVVTAEEQALEAAEDEGDFADAEANDFDPVLEFSRTPAEPTPVPAADALAFPPPPAPVEALPVQPESYTPYPATPVLAVGNGDRAFVLTPAPEHEIAVASDTSDPFRFEAANESEPGLFDISSQPFEPEMTGVRSQPLLNEDHIRRLVEEDERTLAANFDPAFDATPLEQPRVPGVAWLGGAVIGLFVCGGGIAWGLVDGTGDAGIKVAAWSMALGGGGVLLFSAWRWLSAFGLPPMDDEDDSQSNTPAE